MSTAVLTPPPALIAMRPRPHRFTVTEFNRMGDMGWFEGRRAFLLDGIILENGKMDPPHAVVVGLVQAVLQSAFGAGWWVRCQMPFHVDEHNDPMPDLAVVVGAARDYLAAHPTMSVLVVEVADSSLSIVSTEKAERYATAGVTDDWVLDLDVRRLFVLRDPAPLPAGLGATAYRQHVILSPADRIDPLAAPNATIAVSDLLP